MSDPDRVVRCIKQLCNMREDGTPENNKLLSLYSARVPWRRNWPGEDIGWMQEIADQHGLHRDQVEQLIRIVLDLDD